MVRLAYDKLGLQTYFTSGPTETKAWTILKGMTAPQVREILYLVIFISLAALCAYDAVPWCDAYLMQCDYLILRLPE